VELIILARRLRRNILNGLKRGGDNESCKIYEAKKKREVPL